MTNFERKIYNLIKDNGNITIAEIIEVFESEGRGISRIRVRSVVQDLVMKHGKKIGGMGCRNGYHVCRTKKQKEVEAYKLRSQAKQMNKRAKIITT